MTSDDPVCSTHFTHPAALQTFGIPGDLLGLLPGRQTFVFDKNGKCVMSFNDQMNAEKHVDQALQALRGI